MADGEQDFVFSAPDCQGGDVKRSGQRGVEVETGLFAVAKES
jgi:hypothetical protein